MSEAKHIVCPHCAQVNRLPAGRLAEAAKCGNCKSPLFAGRPAEADARMFSRQTGRSDVPVLVDVWAPWCGPCRAMTPAFEEAAHQLEPDMRLIKLNSDNEPDISTRLNIRGIPTMLLFHEGREIARTSGAMPAGQIVAWAKSQMASA